jgi:hypothetical protein
MSLTILIRTQLDSIPVLSDDCYTKQNFGVGPGNSTLSVNTPRGVLGGSIAAISPGLDYTVVPCNLVLRPVGLFVNDAAGAAFENSPAVASGKVAVIKGLPSVEVDVYETESLTGGQVAGTYTVGDLLWSSAQGLLTTNISTEGLDGAGTGFSGTVIGVVTKRPSLASPTLGLDQRI